MPAISPGFARELASMNLDAVTSTCTPTARIALRSFGATPGSTPGATPIIMAAYIGKVGAGANPGEIPVSQPTQCELVANLKTAKALGVALPQTILLSANEVIQ